VESLPKYSCLRAVSILGGLALVGVAAYLNVSHAAESEGSFYSPVCVAIVALAFGSALAVPVMCTLVRTGRKSLALLAFAGLVAAELYGLQLSAERLLSARETRAQQVKTEGSPHQLASEALALATQERKAECATGPGRKCKDLRDVEDAKRAALGRIAVPKSHALVADFTGLPAWTVEILPAMTFSVGLMVLGFVLIGFGGGHGSTERKEEAPAVQEPIPDERERVVSWVRAYRRRHGRSPKIPELQAAFPSVPKTTAWRRISS